MRDKLQNSCLKIGECVATVFILQYFQSLHWNGSCKYVCLPACSVNRLDAEMTPDSLECDLPWSMSHSESQMHSHSDSSSGSLQYQFINADDKIFPDSLNS